MTYTSKFRPAGGRVVAVYTCPEHGEFDCEVERDANEEAPDEIQCPLPPMHDPDARWDAETCGIATWTPTPLGVRVRRVEVTRGKWEKPERKTYLDTRKLGEGQDVEEFRAERRKIWRDERMNHARKEFLNK